MERKTLDNLVDINELKAKGSENIAYQSKHPKLYNELKIVVGGGSAVGLGAYLGLAYTALNSNLIPGYGPILQHLSLLFMTVGALFAGEGANYILKSLKPQNTTYK